MINTELTHFFSRKNVFYENCEGCNAIKKITSCFLPYIDKSVIRDLLLHFVEHSFNHDDKKITQECLNLFFAALPQEIVQFGRALLCRARLVFPEKFDDVKFKKCTTLFTDVCDLSNIQSISNEESEYLSFSCCAIFWNFSRKFVRSNSVQLKPTLKFLFNHLLKFDFADAKWKLYWGLILLESVIVTNEDEALEIWNKMGVFLEQVSVFDIRNIAYKLSLMEKRGKLVLPPKLFDTDAILSYSMEIWALKQQKSVVINIKKEISTISTLLSPQLKPAVSVEFEEKFTTLTQSILTPKKDLFISKNDRFDLMSEFFYLCIDLGKVELAKNCLKNINKLEFEREPLEKDMLKIMIKETNVECNQDPSIKKQKNMIAISKGYRLLQKQIESNEPNLIQSGCVLLWNLCLKFLDRSTREQIYPSLLLIEKALEQIQSNSSELICELSMEMAKCDLFRGDLFNAERHWIKAINADSFNIYDDLLQVKYLHCVITKNQKQNKPLNCDECSVYNLYQLLSTKPKDADYCRSILMNTANAMTDELFSVLLYSEKWPFGIANEEKWLDSYKRSKEEISQHFENLPSQIDKRKFLLWSRISRFAVEYNLWDIGILAAKYCLASNVASQYRTKTFSETSTTITSVQLLNNDERLTALVNLNLVQCLVMKLESYHLSILSSEDEKVMENLNQQFGDESDIHTFLGEIVKEPCVSIANSLRDTISSGVFLGEQWLVIMSAQILWNLIFKLLKNEKLNNLMPLIKLTQKHLRIYANQECTSNLLLLSNYTNCVARQLIKDFSVEKNLSAKTNIQIIGKEAIEMCEETLLIVCQNQCFDEVDILFSLQLLVGAWLKLSHISGVRLENFMSSTLQEKNKKIFHVLIAMECLQIPNYKLQLPEDEESEMSLEKAISRANECELKDSNFAFAVWSTLADLARKSGSVSLFQFCYIKAIDVESKITELSEENSRCSYLLMCLNADITSINVWKRVDNLNLYTECAKKGVSGNDFQFFSLILKLMWNSLYSILKNPALRIILKNPLSNVMDIFHECLKSIVRSTDKMINSVNVDFLELICYIANGLIQVLYDDEEYDLIESHIEKIIYAMHTLKFRHELVDYFKFLSQVFNTDISHEAKCHHYDDDGWLQLANYNRNREIRHVAAYNAFIQCQESNDDYLQRIFTLLTYSEYISFNGCFDTDLPTAIAIIAHNLILESTTGNLSIQSNFVLICVLCQLIRHLKKGSIQYRNLVNEAGSVVLNIWQEIASRVENVKKSNLFDNVANWIDLSIHLNIRLNNIMDQENLKPQQMKSIEKCLYFLSEAMDWLGYYVLMLPVLVLIKTFLINTNQKQNIFLIDLKLLKICIDLNLTQNATDLHSVILQNIFHTSNKVLDFDYLENIRDVNEMRKKFFAQLEQRDNFLKIEAESNENIHLILQEINELLSLRYVGIAAFLLKKIFKLVQVMESDAVFARVTLLLAELHIFAQNYGTARDIILHQQKFITDEKDALKMTHLYLDILIKLKKDDWINESLLVLKETESLYQTLKMKFAHNSELYDEFLLQLQMRRTEIKLIECDKNIDDNCIQHVASLLHRVSECLENGWLKQGLNVLLFLLNSIMNNNNLKDCGYEHPLCAMVITDISNLLDKIEDNLTDDLPDLLKMSSNAILPLPNEFQVVKIKLSHLILILTSSRIDDFITSRNARRNTLKYVTEKYVASLPPWLWNEDDTDYLLCIELIFTTVKKIIENSSTRQMEQLQGLFLTGQCLFLASKYMTVVNIGASSDTVKKVSSTLIATRSPSKTSTPTNLRMSITAQSIQHFVKCAQEAKTFKPGLAANAVLGIIECSLINEDSLEAFQFLLWYQTFEVNRFIKELLLEIFPNPNSSMLASIIHQQRNINDNELSNTPLASALDAIARDEYPFWEFFSLSSQDIDVKSLPMSTAKVIIVLQHSENRNYLYGALYSKKEIKIATTKCLLSDFNKLIDLLNEFHEQWFNYQTKKILAADAILPQLLSKFRSLVHNMETYLDPVMEKLFPPNLPHNFSSPNKSPTMTSDDEQVTSILLLADPFLQQLPLETISFFQNYYISCSIVRDFSIQMYNLRQAVFSAVSSKSNKGDRRRKSGNAFSEGLSVDMRGVDYVIEDDYNVELMRHSLGEDITNFLNTTLNKNINSQVTMGNSSVIREASWKENVRSQHRNGCVYVATPKLCFDLVKANIINTNADPKICILLSYLEKFNPSEKFNFVKLALLLSLARFPTIIINQFSFHKSTVNGHICSTLQELVSNVRGAGIAVNTINGVTTKLSIKVSKDERKISSGSGSGKVQAKWQSEKFIVRTENKFYKQYLDCSLCCYGFPNTVAT